MVDLVGEVNNQRIQSAALLAPAEVFEGVRESDGMFKISAHACQQAESLQKPRRRKELAGSACQRGRRSSRAHLRWARRHRPRAIWASMASTCSAKFPTCTIAFVCGHATQRNKNARRGGAIIARRLHRRVAGRHSFLARQGSFSTHGCRRDTSSHSPSSHGPEPRSSPLTTNHDR
jgi:hypothetical protein